MGVVSRADQIFWIHQVIGSVENIVFGYRVHVVNDHPTVNVVTIDSKITTVVSNYEFVSKTLPFSSLVELLVQISVESESVFPNVTIGQLQILEPLLEGFKFAKFGVRSNHLHHQTDHRTSKQQ